MTFTEQITPYTCGLACLESFYRDHGNPTTQQSLLKEFPAKCFVGRILDGRDISGALALHEFADLCVHLGLEPVVGRDFRPEVTIPFIQSIQVHQAVIFFITHFGGGPTHFVRFSRMTGADVFEVLNPSGNPPFLPITWQQFVAWDTYFVRITLPNELSDA
ncbi:MAG: hypothetical protein WBW41_21065 [Verrucomicrobiia bacterium]